MLAPIPNAELEPLDVAATSNQPLGPAVRKMWGARSAARSTSAEARKPLTDDVGNPEAETYPTRKPSETRGQSVSLRMSGTK